MKNIMLDLETLGLNPHAPVVAIGAVRFDHYEEKLGEEFYVRVDLNEYDTNLGFRIDTSTIVWWLQQSREAIDSTFFGNRYHLHVALNEFAHWMKPDDLVWGNGASFDNVILANAYRAMQMEIPWKSLNDRCYRTIKDRRPDVKIERLGTYHNALDDAKNQARHLMTLLKGEL